MAYDGTLQRNFRDFRWSTRVHYMPRSPWHIRWLHIGPRAANLAAENDEVGRAAALKLGLGELQRQVHAPEGHHLQDLERREAGGLGTLALGAHIQLRRVQRGNEIVRL